MQTWLPVGSPIPLPTTADHVGLWKGDASDWYSWFHDCLQQLTSTSKLKPVINKLLITATTSTSSVEFFAGAIQTEARFQLELNPYNILSTLQNVFNWLEEDHTCD